MGTLSLCLFAFCVCAPPPLQPPFSNFRLHPRTYTGPEAKEPAREPAGTITIGYFGPQGGSQDQEDLYYAAQYAVEEANREGGQKGLRFQLLSAWSASPWQGAGALLSRLIYNKGVCAVVSTAGGAATHVAEQLAAKARVVVLNPCATDKSVNLANVPWVFSCLSGDHLLAPCLAEAVQRRLPEGTVALLESADRDCRRFAEELLSEFRARRIRVARRLVFQPLRPEIPSLLQAALSSGAAKIVITAGPTTTARLVRGLRDSGFSGPVFGGPACGRAAFQREAGRCAEGVIFPLPVDLPQPHHPFVEAFRKRRGRAPDYAACSVYDAVHLITSAVPRAGCNRARLRKEIETPKPPRGITGPFQWDPQGANTRRPSCATCAKGKVRIFTPR